MKNKKTKQIVCIVLAIILIFSLFLPVFAEEKTLTVEVGDTESSSEVEEDKKTEEIELKVVENDDGTTTTTTKTESDSETVTEDGTVIIEHHIDVDTKTELDEEPSDEEPVAEPTPAPEVHNQPGREETAFDNYIDFDLLLKEKRGSTYEYIGREEYDVIIDKSGAEVKIKVHHLENDGEAEEYFVYDAEGKRLSSGVKYSPEEMEITVYNVKEGQRVGIDLIYKDLDGVYITQESSGKYIEQGFEPLESVLAVYGHYSTDEEVHRSLRVKDDVSLEEMEYLLDTYPLIPEDSLLKRDGVAEAFLKAQDNFGVSALGLLAIGSLESAYGTSRIARNKQNLFGWGAVDSNPYDGAWDWSEDETCDAIYHALELICTNYPCGKYGQDSFYSMRYNNNTHQYCTSTTWIYSNARIRAQYEQYLGLR